MYYLFLYLGIAFISFAIGFFLCAILSDSKNREYQEIQTWEKKFEGKDVIHGSKNYLIRGE